jgi:hypothetical protein
MTVYRVIPSRASGFAVEVTYVGGWVQTIDEFATREEAAGWIKDRLAATANERRFLAALTAGGL